MAVDPGNRWQVGAEPGHHPRLARMSLAPGTNLGPYKIVEQVGRGGMATVYKAYHAPLARYVAVKILPDTLADEPGFRERFQREAVSVAQLRHPNILAVH